MTLFPLVVVFIKRIASSSFLPGAVPEPHTEEIQV